MSSLSCQVHFFGKLHIQQADRVVSRFRDSKAALLFAYLAYYNQRPHLREELIEMVWPDSDPAAARNRLSQALSSFRTHLQTLQIPIETFLIQEGRFLRFNPAAFTTDVNQFERKLKTAQQATSTAERFQLLTEAVDLYQGELLPGHYADWNLLERERLQTVYLQALSSLVVQAEQAQEFPRALDFALRIAASDPYDEDIQLRVLRLYDSVGQTSAALRHYQTYKKRLQKELGEVPSSAMRDLVRSLESRKASLPTSPSKVEGRGGRVEGAISPPKLGVGGRIDPEILRLPLRMTSFCGREKEVSLLQTWLSSPEMRLVTLTGPGGSGKTRLALEVAESLMSHWERAVWFVPLASVTEASHLYGSIREALGLPASQSSTPLDQIVTTLSRQPSLLILDNMEQLLDSPAREMLTEESLLENRTEQEGVEVVQTLLARIPALTCLVTSRQSLKMDGEQELRLCPLPTPQAEVPMEQLLEFASVQVFVDRAQAIKSDFHISTANAADIVALCQRLDGIPLALELAAARIQVASPRKMLIALEHRFEFLVSRRRDASQRHRTLHAALDWSYDLLSSALQAFFRKLSVFRNGWTVEAAEVVCEEPLALDYLESLVSCSLVFTTEKEGDLRFHLLETMREYGDEHLTEEERLSLSQHHAKWYRDLAEASEAQLCGPNQREWLEQLEAEQDNLRVALRWGLEAEQTVFTLGLCGALGRFWMTRGHIREAYQWLESAFTLPEATTQTRERAKALLWRGFFGLNSRNLANPVPYYQECLEIYRALGDRAGMGLVLLRLGDQATYAGQHAEATSLLAQSLALFQELKHAWGIAATLLNLGRLETDPKLAEQHFQESVRGFRQVGDRRNVAAGLDNLSNLYLNAGKADFAAPLCTESLEIYRALGEKWRLCMAELTMATITQSCQQYPVATTHYQEALRLAEDLGLLGLQATIFAGWSQLAQACDDLPAATAYHQKHLELTRQMG